MKIIRTSFMVLVAVLAATALVGPASAAADTVLCKSSEDPCQGKQRYASGTDLSATLSEGANLAFASPPMNITCTTSSLTGESTAINGVPLPATIASFTTSSCTDNQSSASCSPLESKNLPSGATVSASGGGDGTLTNTGTGRLTYSCYVINSPTIKWSCDYSFPKMTIEGGSPAALSASGAKVTFLGGTGIWKYACSGEGTVSTMYEIDSPEPLFVSNWELSEADASLCDENKSPCPVESQYPVGTSLKASLSGELTLTSGLMQYKCGTSSLEGALSNGAGEGVPASFSAFSAGTCTFTGGYNCTVEPKSLPWNSEFIPTSDGDGNVQISYLKLRLECDTKPVALTCDYEATGAELDFQGGSSPQMVASKIPMAGTTSGCPASVELSATYEFSAPTDVYIEPV